MAPSAVDIPPASLPSDVKSIKATRPTIMHEPDSGFTKLSSGEKYHDFRDDLAEHGYAVIKDAIPMERALAYQQGAFAWLTSFDRGLDLDNPETWTAEHLPVQSKINTFTAYSVSHEKFMWDARMEPGVLKAFETMWGTSELLVSFDALNITFPNRKDVPHMAPWEHVDQSPLRRGLHCVQGIINLSEAGPDDGGLVVYPGSHKLLEQYLEEATEPSSWTKADFYPIRGTDLEYFTSRGLKPLKVVASPGDLIVWDSRTIHYGSEPTEKSNTIRTVIYATYTPAVLAKEEALKVKKEIFEQYGGTTHWPHDNINPRKNLPLRADGTVDPLNRLQPREMPEKTEQLLKLAGAMAY
ncbi:hypothetical protein BP5796_01077 [Coleophoma crateriformis]|uniref:Phytanoyl-CoA dioxygenase n=1 Tax=Coleophoma crateriformis TaxID=565419 RepID=A0A3D8T9W2_9HELO|nr:hypothetical protein BP5796_01077 [Coleophoma crateriformis]